MNLDTAFVVHLIVFPNVDFVEVRWQQKIMSCCCLFWRRFLQIAHINPCKQLCNVVRIRKTFLRFWKGGQAFLDRQLWKFLKQLFQSWSFCQGLMQLLWMDENQRLLSWVFLKVILFDLFHLVVIKKDKKSEYIHSNCWFWAKGIYLLLFLAPLLLIDVLKLLLVEMKFFGKLDSEYSRNTLLYLW